METSPRAGATNHNIEHTCYDVIPRAGEANQIVRTWFDVTSRDTHLVIEFLKITHATWSSNTKSKGLTSTTLSL